MNRLIFVGVALILAGCGDRGLTNSDALALCRDAIKNVALNPKAVQVPHRKAFRWDGEYTFMWGTEGAGVLMPNQFGALIQTEVHCVVDEQNRKVAELIVDGERLLAR